jgi:hypothetical protein
MSAILLLALSAKVVAQIFLIAGKYPASVLVVAHWVSHSFCTPLV